MITAEQKRLRTQGIGSSDAAARKKKPRRPTISFVADFSGPEAPAHRRRASAEIMRARGWMEFELRPVKDNRSQRANRYYFGCVVAPFFEYLRAQDPDCKEPEDAHYWIKAKCLPPKRITDPATGEIVETVADSRTLSVEEFAEFIERARHWLDTQFGIVTAEAGEPISRPAPKPDPLRHAKAVAHG